MSASALSALQEGLVSCETCGLLSRPAGTDQRGRCPRCGAGLEGRRRQSIQRTWALIIAAAICYIPANILPVLTTHTLVSSESDTQVGTRAHRLLGERWLPLIGRIVIGMERSQTQEITVAKRNGSNSLTQSQ